MKPINIENPWSLTKDQLLQQVSSSENGLSRKEAKVRLEFYGKNSLSTRDQASAFQILIGQYKNPILWILIVATLISAFLREWVDAAIILAIVLGSSLLSFYQEYTASTAAAKLRQRIQIKSKVTRGGQVIEIPAEEIVPGDIVVLCAGSLIPADGVILSSQDFYVNQSVMTGETYPVEKSPGVVTSSASMTERSNYAFMGTNVRSGNATILVVKTGSDTAFGQIAGKLVLKPPVTDFERGISQFGGLLTTTMLVIVLFVLGFNIIFGKPVIDSLLFAIALALGLSPQLLPAIVTVTLAKGSQTMAENGVIVRRLSSIENLGSMNVFCSDKTGTITQGVVHLDGAHDINGVDSEEVFKLAYLNSINETGLSNPLDEAVIVVKKLDVSDYKKIDEIPFDFVRKRLSIVVTNPEGKNLMVMKGAVEQVLEACIKVQDQNQEMPLDAHYKELLNKRFSDWSGRGFRVLGVASRWLPPQEDYTRLDEHDLIFQGFLLFFDPPKEGVIDTIRELDRRGVKLKIITGDNKQVTLHVAQTINLKVDGVLTGAEIDLMPDEALWNAAPKTNLFVEVDPNQKERIIHALQKRGFVVGYMGDGINDAPAIYAADVGISVDTAVDVAKEAADLVLLKTDLSVLNKGVEYGRNTFANTIKYIFITTSANFGNSLSMAGASLFLPFLPLLPTQILLTNFLTDIPSLNIGTDRVDSEMVASPTHWNIKYIRNFMLIFGAISSFFDFLTFGTLLLILHANEVQFHTGWFIESVLTELFVLLIMRTRKRFYQSMPSRSLLITTIVIAVITFSLPFIPLNAVLGFSPLPIQIMLVIVGITLTYVMVTELAKKYFFIHNQP